MMEGKRSKKLTVQLILLTNNSQAMQTLIAKSRELTSLLIEYQEAKIYEKCLYHVVRQADRQNWFFLIEIKTGQIKKDGTPSDLRSWLNLRKVLPETVYKAEDITYPLVTLPLPS